jgi:hypothetical protein
MKNKFNFEDMLDEQYNGCLTEADFYPPSDNRTLKSNVRNIAGGDNFTDYCEYIFDLLEKEGYYE